MTSVAEGPASRRRGGAEMARRWGTVGLIGVLVFWGGQAALHVLRTDLGVVSDYVSDYANGPWGPLFAVATLVHGIGNLAIAVGLTYTLRRDPATRAGVLLFALAALGLLVAGIFPTDPADAPQTVTGLVHRAAATGSFAVELVALGFLALAFRADAAWRSYFRLAVGLTVVAAFMLGWLVVAIASESGPGLPERLALLTFTVWEFATALLLARRRRSLEERIDLPAGDELGRVAGAPCA